MALLSATVGVDVSDGGRLPGGSRALADRVFTELHEQRSWWNRAHVTGEVARLISDPAPDAIELETERIIALCVPLEVDDDHEYSDLAAAKYTSATIQTAERRVLTSATDERGTFAVDTVRDAQLGDDQLAAVDEITGGAGRVATVVGPAGAGKTTLLRSVAASFEHAERPVIVLTLSAAAARVVADETGLNAYTIAGWRIGAVDMPRNGLVIVDEASMVPTLVLDEMVRVAGVYGSKMTLIGDFAQMGAPEAGGLLRDLAALPSTVELTAVRRFRHTWEAEASLQLRARNDEVAPTYSREERILESTTDTVFDDVAAAWWADIEAGKRSMIVVDTTSDAADVSTRCQQHLLVGGHLGDHVADAADGCRIHIGDSIQTRRNTSPSWPATSTASSTATFGPSPARPPTAPFKFATAPARDRRPARRLRVARRRPRIRNDDRRSARAHGRLRTRRRHPADNVRVALRRDVPRTRRQPRPHRVRQPRPRRVRTGRPHR